MLALHFGVAEALVLCALVCVGLTIALAPAAVVTWWRKSLLRELCVTLFNNLRWRHEEHQRPWYNGDIVHRLEALRVYKDPHA